MFDVKGKAAIVTGGAQGLGKEFCQRLLKAGAKVCVADVDATTAEKTYKEFAEKYGKENVTFIKCDVTVMDDWNRTWDKAVADLGCKVAVLVNNAGVNPNHGVRRCLDIMISGVSDGTFLALDKMAKSKGGDGGRIINIASMAGLATDLGRIEAAGYTMAKWGVVALTRSFGTAKPNLSKTEDIKCFALCPYFVDTKLVRDVLDVTKIEKMFGYRTFSVSEIGDYFDLAMKLDSNGSCYGLMPDFPMLDIPNANKIVFVTYGLIGKLLQPLGVTSIGTPVVIATIVLFALLLFTLLSVIF